MKNLTGVIGINETPILVVVDGMHRETLHLLKVLLNENSKDFLKLKKEQSSIKTISKSFNSQLQVIVHKPKYRKTHTRINENVKFALIQAFIKYPKVDKVIVLEDDLLVSPDIIR